MRFRTSTYVAIGFAIIFILTMASSNTDAILLISNYSDTTANKAYQTTGASIMSCPSTPPSYANGLSTSTEFTSNGYTNVTNENQVYARLISTGTNNDQGMRFHLKVNTTATSINKITWLQTLWTGKLSVCTGGAEAGCCFIMNWTSGTFVPYGSALSTTSANYTTNYTNTDTIAQIVNSTDGRVVIACYCDQGDSSGGDGIETDFAEIRYDYDNTAPSITNVLNWSITGGSANINWTTNETANSSVKYGTTLALSDGTASQNALLTIHNINLSGINDNTTYYYNITSCDLVNNCHTVGPYNFTTPPFAKPPFISTWNTSRTTVGSSNSTTITLPLQISGTYNFLVDWGDGQTGIVTSWNDPDKSHAYASQGKYTIRINGTIIGFRFNNGGDRNKIDNIEQWGILNLGNEYSYFSGANNLTINATDQLNMTNTTTLQQSFNKAYTLNSGLENLNVSRVNDMLYLFYEARNFNGNISNWDTSQVTRLYGVFYRANNFNQDISLWNTSNTTSIGTLFFEAENFNGNLSNWDVSKVTVMHYTFEGARKFNQYIGMWNTQNVLDMQRMFFNATSFNQNLGTWNISNVTNMKNMLNYTNLSVYNYDQTLIGWSQQVVVNNVNFSAGNLKYSTCGGGLAARNILTGTYNWTITDGGLDDSGCGGGSEPDVSIQNYYPQTNLTISKNTLFNYTVNVSCTISDCGTILVYARSNYWYNTSWPYRKSITFNRSKISGDLLNFPVLINLTDSSLSTNALENGSDIIFVNQHQTSIMDFEVEHWNKTTGQLAAWVRVDNLSNSTEQSIYLYYGNAASSYYQNKTGVWDANYTAVFHLADTSGNHTDSSKYSNNATYTSIGSMGRIPSKVGMTSQFNSTQAYTTYATHNESLAIDANGQLTLSSWFYANCSDDCEIVSKGPNYDFYLNDYYLTFYFNGVDHVFNYLVTPNTWTHAAVAFDDSTNAIKYYINGQLHLENTTTNSFISGSDPLAIGSYQGSSWHFTGYIDEVRVSRAIKSTEWIITEYNNQHSPSTFYTVSEETNQNSSVISSTRATPFYTNSSPNPVNISLSSGQSQLVVFWINATSDDGSAYQVSSSAHRLSLGSPINSSNAFNVTATTSGIVIATNSYKYVLYTNRASHVTSTAQSGINAVLSGTNQTSGNYTSLIYLNFAQDIDTSNLNSNTSYSPAKTFIHNTTSITGLINISLLVPIVAGTNEVYVCPGATNLDQVNPNCANIVYIRNGSSGSGMSVSTVIIDGESYYLISNITGTGAGEVNVPIMQNTSINPSPTAYVYQNLTGYVNATDADNDSLYYQYTWYKNGVAYIQDIAIANGSLSIGASHACAIRANDSKILCWGLNSHGQIGNAVTGGSYYTPQLISSSDQWKDVKVIGSRATCAIRSNDSTIHCWGRDSIGQLGNGIDTNDYDTPQHINASGAFKSLATSEGTACAIRANDSRVLCWGDNTGGFIGNGTTGGNQHNPTPTNDTDRYKKIYSNPVSWHFCAIRANDSTVKCWGANTDGQLGNGSTGSNQPNPTPINSTAAYLQIATARFHTCAILANTSTTQCWGYNSVGQLGTGDTTARNTPTYTLDQTPKIKIAATRRTTCAIRTNDSTIHCWGDNTQGEIGNGTVGAENNTGTIINSTGKFINIIMGGSQDTTTRLACAIRANDTRTICWGDNSQGLFSNGSLGTTTPNPTTNTNETKYAQAYNQSRQVTVPEIIYSSYLSAGQNWTLSARAFDGYNFSATQNSTWTMIVANSCTYPGYGDWNVNGSENCNITTNVNLGKNSFYISGSGTIQVSANITNYTVRRTSSGVNFRLGRLV